MKGDFGSYRRGFSDGQAVLFEQVVSVLDEDPHPVSCDCKPCQVVQVVWGEAMRTVQAMIGPEEWHKLGNRLATAAGLPPRPPYSE